MKKSRCEKQRLNMSFIYKKIINGITKSLL